MQRQQRHAAEANLERFRELVDHARRRQEREHIARVALLPIDRLLDAARHRLEHRRVRIGLRRRLDRAMHEFDRMLPSRHVDDRRSAEVRRERLGGDRRGSDHDAQIGSSLDRVAQRPEQQVDRDASLVRFVEDDRVVVAQERIAPEPRREHAIGADLDPRSEREPPLEAGSPSDAGADRDAAGLGKPRGDRPRGDATGLGDRDPPVDAATDREAEPRDLGALAAARRTAHDDDPMPSDRLAEGIPDRGDREFRRRRVDADRHREAKTPSLGGVTNRLDRPRAGAAGESAGAKRAKHAGKPPPQRWIQGLQRLDLRRSGRAGREFPGRLVVGGWGRGFVHAGLGGAAMVGTSGGWLWSRRGLARTIRTPVASDGDLLSGA